MDQSQYTLAERSVFYSLRLRLLSPANTIILGRPRLRLHGIPGTAISGISGTGGKIYKFIYVKRFLKRNVATKCRDGALADIVHIVKQGIHNIATFHTTIHYESIVCLEMLSEDEDLVIFLPPSRGYISSSKYAN